MATLACLWVLVQDGDILARVNDTVITRYEVDRELAASRYAAAVTQDNIASLRREMLRELAERRLFEQAADEANLTVTGEEVEEELANRIRSIGGRERFEIFLRINGMTEEQFREQLRMMTLSSLLVQRHYARWINTADAQIAFFHHPTPADAWEYYSQHPEEFESRDEVAALQLVQVCATAGEREESRRLLEQVIRRLDSGSDFFVMARQYSTPGTRTEVRASHGDGTLSPQIERLVFEEMEPGSHSGIIELPNALVLLQVQTRSRQEAMVFEEAFPIVVDRLRYLRWQENSRLVRDLLVQSAYYWPEDLFEE